MSHSLDSSTALHRSQHLKYVLHSCPSLTASTVLDLAQVAVIQHRIALSPGDTTPCRTAALHMAKVIQKTKPALRNWRPQAPDIAVMMP